MKRIEIADFGPPDTLSLVEAAAQQPGTGEVRIRVAAAGVNYADTLQRRGTYPVPVELPFAPGNEVAGVVEAIGPGVSAVRPGARVAALLQSGGYAEYVTVDAASVFPLPDRLGFEQAVALLVQGLTAWALTEAVGSRLEGANVLITAAAGGVGTIAVQLARRRGAVVIGAVGQRSKVPPVRELGADHVVVYSEEGWTDALRAELRGGSIDVVLDAVGGRVFRDALQLLGPGGETIVYGASSGELAGLPPERIGELIFNNQSIHGLALPGRIAADPAWLPRTAETLFRLAVEGQLSVRVHPPFPLELASEAHRAIESRETTGKVVLTPSS